MEPLRGWAPVGQRIKAKVPHGHWKTMTFLAALRLDRVEAPWLIDGPINGERFQIYVEKVLIPTLRPGDIVVMDNLGSHKAKVVRRADNLHNWIVLDVSGPIVIEARPLELNDCDRSTVISPSTRLSPKNARSRSCRLTPPRRVGSGKPCRSLLTRVRYVAAAHCGSGLPVASATMYSAYQAGQFSSR
jgi:hypothetical protein